jgi:hypothetical protein
MPNHWLQPRLRPVADELTAPEAFVGFVRDLCKMETGNV